MTIETIKNKFADSRSLYDRICVFNEMRATREISDEELLFLLDQPELIADQVVFYTLKKYPSVERLASFEDQVIKLKEFLCERVDVSRK